MQTSSSSEAEKLRGEVRLDAAAEGLPARVREILLAQPLNPLHRLAFSPVPRLAARRVAPDETTLVSV